MRIIALCNRSIGYAELLGMIENYQYVLLLGGIVPGNSISGNKFYSVSGRFDDHYIADILRERTLFVESSLLYLGEGWYIAGIGGRDPVANINAVEKLFREARTRENNMNTIIASYFCPFRICDRSALGGRRGIPELYSLIQEYFPRVVVSCECGPGVVEIGEREGMALCLGGGACRGAIDIQDNDKVLGRVHCGEPWHGAPDNGYL